MSPRSPRKSTLLTWFRRLRSKPLLARSFRVFPREDPRSLVVRLSGLVAARTRHQLHREARLVLTLRKAALVLVEFARVCLSRPRLVRSSRSLGTAYLVKRALVLLINRFVLHTFLQQFARLVS